MASFDCVIRNADVYDGSGSDAVRADVAIEGGKIAALGDVGRAPASKEIDGTGMALAPGFIDVHTHDDRALIDTAMSPKTSQGVTTVVVGNCGISLAPLALNGPPPPPLNLLGDQSRFAFPRFADYVARLETGGGATNAACLCGHSTLRVQVMDGLDRPATDTEIAEMKSLLTEALDAGAIGLSTGLDYAPAKQAPREEIEQLAALCVPYNAIHTTHIRDESDQVIDALDEAFTIGRNAAVPVLVSHFKCSGVGNWGRSTETLAFFDAASKTQDVSLDAYPYAASSTVLKPGYVSESKRILVTWSTPHPEMGGRDLSDIAEEWDVSLLDAAGRLQPAGAVYFAMDEADVRRILSYRNTMIGSDGLPHDAHPHPRLWGTFPRVLGHYARDVGLFPLPEAIHRMTGLPARRFNLAGRGTIAEGNHADLVLFDPKTILDTATFENPMQPADGIHTVWVNGAPVWQAGKSTGARPGHVLRPAAA